MGSLPPLSGRLVEMTIASMQALDAIPRYDRHADHHHFTVQHLDADLNITGKREVRHNPEMILRSLITRHGVIDLDEVA